MSVVQLCPEAPTTDDNNSVKAKEDCKKTSLETKRYQSEEAQALAGYGETALAEDAESRHLVANGRISSSTGEVNGPGSSVRGARLMSFDSENNTVCLRVDCGQIPEFWLEIELPMGQLLDFVRKEEEEDSRVREGLVFDKKVVLQ